MVMPAFVQLLNLCVIGFALALQGSTGLNPSQSPEHPSVSPPIETAPGPIPDQKSFGSNVPSPALQPSGSKLLSPPAMPPPLPRKTEGQVPSVSPSTPVELPPQNTAPSPLDVQSQAPSVPPQNTTPPPLDVQSHAPSVPPLNTAPPPSDVQSRAPSVPPLNTAPPPSDVQSRAPSVLPNVPPNKEPVNNGPISVAFAPVQVQTPPRNAPPVSPVINSGTPETSPSSSHQGHAPGNKDPIPEKISPAPVSSLPRASRPIPSVVHSTAPSVAPTVLPVPVASPSRLPQIPPSSHPVTPGESPSTLPADPVVSPVSSPLSSIIRRKDVKPVAAAPYEAPKPSLPLGNSPATAPSAHIPLVSSPSPSIHGRKGRTPIVASPYEAPKSSQPAVSTPAKAPSVHKPVGQFKLAPAPSDSSPEPPSDQAHHSPESSPPSSFHRHTRKNITNPSTPPSYSVSPSTSKQQGPLISPVSAHTQMRRHYAPPPLYPGGSSAPSSDLPVTPRATHVSPAPSPSLKDASDNTRMPPNLPPSGSLSTDPKVPPLPQIHSLPPPPPNEDCSAPNCADPYTNTPPGSPCICVLPMQVGLRLSVPLYTFFPLVSELAQELAVGVFMEQSQVRIIGANAATQNPEKTVVLVDLVPLGETFDNTTAFLTTQRFWQKQVVIKASYFGAYEVLYVRYPGLPPSPPSSDADVINAGPYPGNGNIARSKPFGVAVPKRHKNGLSSGIIAIIALSTFAAIALCSVAAWVFLFRLRDRASQVSSTPRTLLPSIGKRSGTAASMRDSRHSSASLSFGSSIATYTGSANTFSASDISKATNNFDPARILGEGGFGLVYSGDLEDGTKVAVKVLKRDDQQGGREFLAEVEMLSRLHHRNLVKLIGICVEEHRCLVYELIPNGSVESHLHGIDKETAPLSWGPRMKIALGAARGLAYLHEDSSPRVIHRDFKSSNILLENDFTPKVSDFGLARAALDEENRHISTRVMGTFGYVAPEYAMTGHLLVKSDVYSYGVVLLELLSGRKPVDMSQPPGEENLVAWARPLLTSREGLETLMDQNLGCDVPFDSIAKVAAIASMCVQPEVSHRPFMGEVVQALKLVCSEFDEAKEIGSRCSSREDLSIDMAAGASTGSEQPYHFERQYSAPTYDLDLEIEREASLLKMFSSSARNGREDSESFRRHSSSGPLGTGRSNQFWQRLKSSGGSVSEHGFMYKLW